MNTFLPLLFVCLVRSSAVKNKDETENCVFLKIKFDYIYKVHRYIYIYIIVLSQILFENVDVSRETEETKKLSARLLKRNSQSQIKDADIERSDRINRGFEKIIDFIDILSQMNNFVYDRTRNTIRKLNVIYD